jgi:hypothetical protein
MDKETGGPVVFVLGMVGFVVLAAAGMTGTIDDLAVFVLGSALVERLLAWTAAAAILAVFVVAWRASVQRDRVRVHFRPDRYSGPNADHVRNVSIPHEALGHAAVAAGVKAKGIRARVFEDGSGWVEAERRGLTLAERLAITIGGEVAAGPVGCDSDRAKFKRDLRRAPARYRDAVKAEAIGLAQQHHGNAFGRKVERALLRTGRFR